MECSGFTPFGQWKLTGLSDDGTGLQAQRPSDGILPAVVFADAQFFVEGRGESPVALANRF